MAPVAAASCATYFPDGLTSNAEVTERVLTSPFVQIAVVGPFKPASMPRRWKGPWPTISRTESTVTFLNCAVTFPLVRRSAGPTVDDGALATGCVFAALECLPDCEAARI